MAQEDETLELVKRYGRRRGQAARNILLGTPMESTQDRKGSRLRMTLARLKDAQLASRAAAKSQSEEEWKKSQDNLHRYIIQALASYGSSANSAQANRFSTLHRERANLKKEIQGEKNFHADQKWRELRSRMAGSPQWDLANPNLQNALSDVLNAVKDNSGASYIFSKAAETFGVSEAEARRQLTSGAGEGPLNLAHRYNEVDNWEDQQGQRYKDVKNEIMIIDGELLKLPGTSYGGPVLRYIQSIQKGDLTEEETDAALKAAIEALPKETNVMKETASEIEGGMDMASILREASGNAEFQFEKELAGFDSDRKFMNFLLRRKKEDKGPSRKETKREDEKRSIQSELASKLWGSDVPEPEPVDSPEALEAYFRDVNARAKRHLDAGENEEALSVFMRAEAHLSEAILGGAEGELLKGLKARQGQFDHFIKYITENAEIEVPPHSKVQTDARGPFVAEETVSEGVEVEETVEPDPKGTFPAAQTLALTESRRAVEESPPAQGPDLSAKMSTRPATVGVPELSKDDTLAAAARQSKPVKAAAQRRARNRRQSMRTTEEPSLPSYPQVKVQTLLAQLRKAREEGGEVDPEKIEAQIRAQVGR